MSQPRARTLFRYSARRWLERSLQLGEFRLRPASDYQDVERDVARRDDERSLTYEMSGAGMTAQFLETGQIAPIVGTIKLREGLATDYLVLCLSSQWSGSLFDEFSGSDCCLVIERVSEFAERLHHAAEIQLASWIGHDAPVEYAVPLDHLGVSFAKPWRFRHQHEYRFSWLPREAREKLTPRLVTMGNIEDIAHLAERPK